ncbi:uncharacterized protein Z519_10124 [Cladophialophora bantiana CBS 173.52]|uniref:Transcriptional regulator n=1 Tax=Cladophialophora bantiana (strain ATCC 10958 / CBS 173.52 / CDC B-1940 / NIH 8579) TaxID=1442370 RepID=A0A0D2EGU5_CLAB1|nr:uncharacterized protein Z519_10124 [Cladophialophora bantiana CBS 173.52]KIW89271.1 hypothetical protein Z519_10124 [Cladophialophora bantiana CBS 173.52]
MSASDSELSEASRTPAPPDHELERSLRREVVKAQRDGIDFSTNYIREASEAKLGLTKGFYKTHHEWAERSKAIIAEQWDIQSRTQSSPVQPKPKQWKKTPLKRKSSEKESAPKKRRKAIAKSDGDVSDGLSSPLSDLDSEALQEKSKTIQSKALQKPRPTKSTPAHAKRAKIAGSNEEDEDEKQANGAVAEESSNEGETAATNNADGGSESEMSVLLDEARQQKKTRKGQNSVGQRPKKPNRSSARPGAGADVDPDQAEIKRLQGWLLKCGIRKLWGKELKPYETSKAKIKHLKEMLADVGMTGRYSLEKANQIKEARELAADIEAVQEGAVRWGAAEDQDGVRGEKEIESGARPAARRLVRGAKNYDFLSSDGEETD